MQRLADLGAISVYCKRLAENDNSKQQIYLGGNFDVVQIFPFHDIETNENGKDSTYKAKLDFKWINDSSVETAQGAQLILYPQYPEVRLSGFLKGCKISPSIFLRPVQKGQRKFNNGHDGRILFLAVTQNRETLAYLAPASSQLSLETISKLKEFEQKGLLFKIPLADANSRIILLDRLKLIRDAGWHNSVKLSNDGILKAYKAKNGGGYTLEGLLGISPNGRSEPDFMGWEIKGYSGDRVTLMTPEPTGGFYGENGVEKFVRKFGRPTTNDTLYFTGLHRSGIRNASTKLTLHVNGFDKNKSQIEDVNGAVQLLTDSGEIAASWSFEGLLMKWNKKHAQAAYIPYQKSLNDPPTYQYNSPALMGEGTNFNLYLHALSSGLVFYDPASKVTSADSLNSKVKARSQFRMPIKKLATLYQKFEIVEF
ncbi:MvaI/BcnI family restriction endonuclease [Methylophilus sp. OH31]|uniref:MvaI/BcnI family restriction endonuclease n=1 Tax=Methylophilus sp. OH31 TaxID=1387312 RepID=UPI00130E6B2C|nr:MvaI/BcnI family restriction endonuclease [Methylophilus sp. OH31]